MKIMSSNKKMFCLLWMALFFGACRKDDKLPPDPVLGRILLYNASPAFFEKNGKFVLADKMGSSDTVIAPYNAMGTSEGGSAVGAIQAAYYYMQTPGIYRTYFLDSLNKAVDTKEVTLNFEKRQSVYLTDSLGYLSLIQTNDDTERAEGKVKVRLLNLSADAGPIVLYLDSTLVAGIQPRSFREVSDFVEVPTTVKSGIRILTADDKGTLLSRKSFALEGGRCYTLILHGYVTPPPNDDQRIRQNQTISLSAIINQ